MIKQPLRIKAVLFDFDGTLTKPGALDFSAVKQAVGCPDGSPVLEFINGLDDPVEHDNAWAVLNRFETRAAEISKPNDGAEKLLSRLRSKGIAIGLITRNSIDSIKISLQNFEQTTLDQFDVVITRDDPVNPKPSPDGIRLAARKLGVESHQILVVGDYIFDIQAGKRAGATTLFLKTPPIVDVNEHDCDFTVDSLNEVEEIVNLGIPLKQGKLPNGLLDRFLDHLIFDDPALLITPGVGEDTAATDISEDEVLVLKSDPITFATDAAGQYAVLVNANDIATSGAIPRWFMTTLLFPPGTTGSSIWLIMDELNTIARKYDITLCGGHTEITDAVTRPVLIGSLVGTVAKENLIDKSHIQPGDRVLMTKAVAVEGTAIIAREFGERLKSMGVGDVEIENCRRLIDQVSILEEAKIAVSTGGVSAMHDVTEGGLSSAVYELSAAGRHGIEIQMDAIPVFPETENVCNLLGISPLGLIGSGTLLICCRPEQQTHMTASIEGAGIAVTQIGEVLDRPVGIYAKTAGGPTTWPTFEVDEIARLFNT